MNEFKQAAENAADEVIDQMENDNFDPEYVEFIIAKHFAPLAEQHAMLVELAVTQQKRFALYDMMCEAQNPDLSDDKKYELEQAANNAPDYESRAMEILANPLIAPLLKEETK